MIPEFRDYIKRNEVAIRTAISTGDDVYTTSQLGGLANLSGDWRQKLKQSLDSQSIYGDVDFASLNMNNAVPIIGMNKSTTVTIQDGGIFQGKIVISEIDILENPRIEDKINGDLNAIMSSMYYTLDDIVYGNLTKYTQKGIYGIISNPNVSHGATSLAATYGNSTASEIIEDLKLFIIGYIEGLNSDPSQRAINDSTLNFELKMPSVIYNTISTSKEIVDSQNSAITTSVLQFMEKWILEKLKLNIKIVKDVGLDLVSPIIKESGYKVMQIGVYSKTYMTLEVPFAPHRAGADEGFYAMESGDSCKYSMKALGTQINRTNMFKTRDV